MKHVLRIMIEALPMNIIITLLIGIACRSIPSAIVGMIIAHLLFFVFGSFMEWKYPR